MELTLSLRRLADRKQEREFQGLMERALREAENLMQDDSVGFIELPETTAYVDQCDRVLDQLPQDVDRLLVLGIGGSALGTRMILDALPEAHNRRVDIVDNVDSHTVSRFLRELDPERTVLNVVSKSGSTVEPLALFRLFYGRMKGALGEAEAQRRIVLTTDPEKGALRQLAEEMNLQTLPVPKQVGGRFSVLSPVGLFPCMFAGVDVIRLLLGARKEKRDGLERICTGAVLDYMFAEAGKSIKVVFPYSDRMQTFGEWYLQLFAESLGKRVDNTGREVRTGQTAVVAKGVTDQHSQLQLYREGPANKVFAFFRIADMPALELGSDFEHLAPFGILDGQCLDSLMQAECEGTMQSLENDGQPVMCYELEQINAETLGRLIFLFEMQTAVTGRLLNIDPFNQPGVEEGKRIAKELMGGS